MGMDIIRAGLAAVGSALLGLAIPVVRIAREEAGAMRALAAMVAACAAVCGCGALFLAVTASV